MWAAENWLIIDGRCALAGVDPLQLRARRFVALLYTMLVDVPTFTEEAEEARKRLMAELEWPEVNEVREARDIERQTGEAMAYYGVSIANYSAPVPDEGGPV